MLLRRGQSGVSVMPQFIQFKFRVKSRENHEDKKQRTTHTEPRNETTRTRVRWRHTMSLRKEVKEEDSSR